MRKFKTKDKKAIRYLILTLTLVFACTMFSLSAYASSNLSTDTGSSSSSSKFSSSQSSSSTPISHASSIPSSSSAPNPSSSSRPSYSSKPASSKASSKSLPSWDNDDDSVDGTLSDVDLGDDLPLDSSSDGVSSSAALIQAPAISGRPISPMLVGGIVLIILGLAGIGFFIYLQRFSKGNTMADITQQAKRDAKRYKRNSSQRRK